MNFDQVYSQPDLYYKSPTRVLREFAENISSSMKVLDLGCGDGRNSLWMLEAGHNVTAIDISSTAIKKLTLRAKQRGLHDSLAAHVETATADAIFEQDYDFIIASTLLCHLDKDRSDWVLGKIKDSLVTDGHCYISVFTICDPSYKPSNLILSETASAVVNHFETNELLSRVSDLTVVRYSEGVELDASHGRPHSHGIARAIARKGKIC